MYMKHPGLGGVAEVPDSAFAAVWSDLGWVSATRAEYDTYAGTVDDNDFTPASVAYVQQLVGAAGAVADYTAGTLYRAQQLVVSGGVLYRRKATGTPAGAFVAGEWDAVGAAPGSATSGTVLLDGQPVTEADPLDIDSSPVVAADVGFTPTGSTGAMTVQDAVVEVAADAAAATASVQTQVNQLFAQLAAATDRITLLEGGAVTSALLSESGNVLTTEAGDVLVLA